ncbi:MAG: hypothetical protein HDR27_08520 [Lachnospiraceae bacterium]|nr:hypothetical protein [Lachnospiraceae bacterium]
MVIKMEYGHFLEGGKKYEVTTPFTPAPWKNILYNDTYYLEVDQTLQGNGQLVNSYNRTPCICRERYFYLVDRKSGKTWNPNYLPLGKDCDSYSCVHGIWNTTLTSAREGIETTIEVMVPPTGTRELWSLSIQNQSMEEREISLYTVFGFYDHGVMGGECIYDEEEQVIVKYAFPYHTLYEEKEKVEKEPAYFYLFPDRKPDSCDMSRRRFFGSFDGLNIPHGIKNGVLSGKKGEAEDFCGAFCYNYHIKPNEKAVLFLEAGAAVTKEQIFARKRNFGKVYVEEERANLRKAWEETENLFFMETPDENLNGFGNYWLKKQITLLTRQNRGSSYCPTRNQLQDAMGYAMFAPEEAGKYIWDVMRLQKKDGSLKQWHDTTGAPDRGLCLLNHMDAPVWLVICTEIYIRQKGEGNLFGKRIPYLDGGDGTVLEHLLKALHYLYQSVGTHGLCLMGDGDWNDPINGVGRDGKGESVWLSMALVYATQKMLVYLDAVSDERDELADAMERMKAALNRYAWDGKWYAAAIHDDGVLLGGRHDRLFLNTQSWAFLAGIVDEEKRRFLAEAFQQLATPFGPLILEPPFQEWDARWGRISVKKSGTTENGSVYCHASMFLAYARAKEKDAEGLYETLWRTLPTNPENAPFQNLQIPIYLANYYYGLRDSDNFGRSSQHYGTGTAAWMMLLLVEEMLGAESTVWGLRIHPLLPPQWNRVSCRKRYRNAVYHIIIKRGDAGAVTVDGQPYEKEFLPYQDGKTYRVEVCV